MTNIPTYRVTLLTDKVLAVECSDGQSIVSGDYREVLEFFVRNPADCPLSAPRLVWRVADLVSCLRHLLPEFAVKMLDTEPNRAIWDDFRLYNKPGKMFQVNVDHDEVLIYSLKQFFPDDTPEPSGIDELQSRSDELVSAFASIGVSQIKQLHTPVAVMEDAGLMKDTYNNLPTFEEIPDGCLDYAMEVGGMLDKRREWNECYQVGYFPELYSYDVSSCYGYHASRLPNLDGAIYKHSKHPVDTAYFGFLKGELTINPEHRFAFCSPIVYPVGDSVSNPVGVISGYFSLEQVRFIERNGMGTFALKDGWYITSGKGERPLANIVEKFYQERSGASPLVSHLLKRAITGVIGRMGEWRKSNGQDYRPGPYLNPVYRSYIISNAALQVGQCLIDRRITTDELVLVGVDGFYSTRRMTFPAVSGLGKWRDAGSLRLLIASFNDRFKGDDCDKVLEEIKDNPDSMVYSSLDLSSSRVQVDRYFKHYPRTGKELLKKPCISAAVVL